MKKNPSIALTGATGFIGGALAEECFRRGIQLSILVRAESDRSRELAAQGARVILGDLNATSALDDLCAGADSLIHCAAYMAKNDREKSIDVNVGGTRRLLESASRAQVGQFLYVSSISVYRGTDSATRVFTEEMAPYLHPRLNNYSLTKLQGEHVVEAFCKDDEMDYITVRPTNVYGPGCRPWGTDVEKFTQKFHMSFGRIPFNFIHIEDLVNAMLATLESTDSRNQAFNLGCEMIPLREFYEYIARKNETKVMRLPGFIDAAIRHGMDLYGRLQRQVRSTGYTIQSHYPHSKATDVFGYTPKHFVRTPDE